MSCITRTAVLSLVVGGALLAGVRPAAAARGRTVSNQAIAERIQQGYKFCTARARHLGSPPHPKAKTCPCKVCWPSLPAWPEVGPPHGPIQGVAGQSVISRTRRPPIDAPAGQPRSGTRFAVQSDRSTACPWSAGV